MKFKAVINFFIIVILAILGYSGYTKVWNKEDAHYSIVYLESKEIYVGKLTMFPQLKMSNGYFLSITADPKGGKDTFQLVPLGEAVWAPKELYLNEDSVLFYGPLLDSSPAADALKKAGK